MSSKFFTWTKGDRRNAAEALHSDRAFVPIPAECISIKGMDYARTTKGSSKANRRPTPLSIEGSPEPTSKHSSRTNDSIALHDAAVQSATSLMTVINDMLRSPPLSAHILAQNHPDALKPMHGRPRSKTAPSTPLVEAPMVEPVELPGSFPLEEKTPMSHFSMDGKRYAYLLTQSPASASFGASIIRPHSSPQEATHPILEDPNDANARVSSRSKLLSPGSASPRAKSASPLRSLERSASYDSGDDTLVAHDSNTLTIATERPSLSNLLDNALQSDSLPPSLSNSRAASSDAVAQLDSSHNGQLSQEETHQPDAEALLMQQISGLRASHDAHILSLKEAHEREIASHRSYISFLESRKGLTATSVAEGKQALTIDTSHSAARPGELLTSDASANTLQSFELSLENQKRASQEASQGVEALKRKLSLCRKAQADAVDIRRERDQLREAAGRSDRRILQLKDIVRKAKENEKAMKNATADLEARLVLANNERIDVLEGYHEACGQVQNLSKRANELSKELESSRERQFQSQTAVTKSSSDTSTNSIHTNGKAHDRTVSDAGTAVAKDGDALLQQVQELRRMLASKDAHIRRLEEVISAGSSAEHLTDKRDTTTQSSWLSRLQQSLEEHKQMLAAAKTESDKYNSLLHNELRRQSRSAAEKALGATPKIEAEAFVVATEKMVRLKAQTKAPAGGSGNVHTEPLATLLERELEHCIKEIIMYKGDLKTCKKDLRKAQAKIDSMEAMDLQRPPTPDGESAASGRSDSPRITRSVPVHTPQHPPAPSGTPDSGLGISLPASQHTPTKTVATATAAALLSPTPASKSAAATSPSMRPKSPLGKHKRLPKPPASPNERPLPATPPPPSIKLQRNETLRSLSESIISSYTKRPTSEQEPYTTPPSRDRSSAPLQSLGSPMAPASRFATPRQVPTPVSSQGKE